MSAWTDDDVAAEARRLEAACAAYERLGQKMDRERWKLPAHKRERALGKDGAWAKRHRACMQAALAAADAIDARRQ